MFRRAAKPIVESIRAVLGTQAIHLDLWRLRGQQSEAFYYNEMLHNPRYQDPRRLNRFEYRVYSQNGEDGIISEIFKTVGITNRVFVEFGVGDGSENNTTYLLTGGWTGYWLEAGEKKVRKIRQSHGGMIDASRLTVRRTLVTAENIETLFRDMGIPEKPDLLSIDIDGNDYWVWKAINSYRPRVVVIEYNPFLGPELKWVMGYNPQHVWDGSSYYGASLKSLEVLGQEKGYRLVGCDFTGNNAFFVSEELVTDRFAGPFTAEVHYEPPRYGPYRTRFGPFENV